MKFYKFLIFFICALQVSFLYTAQESFDFAHATTDTSDFAPDWAQESSDFAQGFFGHGKATTDKKVEDEDTCNQQLDQFIIGDETITNRSEINMNQIKEYVSCYPHLDEGFRILQISNPLMPSFHDFLVNRFAVYNDDNNEQMPHLGEIIQNAENIISVYMKNAFFSHELKFATECIYKNPHKDFFDEIFSKISMKAEQDNDKSALDQKWSFNIQTIQFVMKHRHNFMKNILKSWFDEEFKMLHQEYFNVIFEKSKPSNSGNGLEIFHFGHMINTNFEDDNSCMLQFILEIDPNYLQFQDKTGNGLLHYAAQKNAIRCAQLLIDQKININLHNYSSASPLFLAATQGNTKITQILIDAHANLEIKSKSRTALFQAVENNHIEITRLLINARANQRLYHIRILNPLEHAVIYRYEDIVDILIHAHPNSPSYDCLKLAQEYARTPGRKAEIQRIINNSYPEMSNSCCTIS